LTPGQFGYIIALLDKEFSMPFTLIKPTGERMQFYILSLAETYQQIYGGVLLKNNGLPHLKLVDKLAA
jgi:hypothetical protein